MLSLHVANTFFEWELSLQKIPKLSDAFSNHEVYLQLQYLPLLYAQEDDGILVSELPAEEDLLEIKKLRKIPALHLLSEKNIASYDKIEDWGASRSIQQWSLIHRLSYQIPSWETVIEVNSKAFSFAHSPKLPFAKLLFTKQDALDWMQTQTGSFVFKTCFGVSGRGHHISDPNHLSQVLPFLDKELHSHHPLIAEPWVERVMDFSTQWEITQDQKVLYLGATICESDPKGRHKGNKAGSPDILFKDKLFELEEHKKIAFPLLEKIAKLGYLGNVGIDAMIYKQGKDELLHPVVEINARKTMGWAALKLQQLYFPENTISLSYTNRKDKGLLPTQLLMRKIKFKKQLFVDIID